MTRVGPRSRTATMASCDPRRPKEEEDGPLGQSGGEDNSGHLNRPRSEDKMTAVRAAPRRRVMTGTQAGPGANTPTTGGQGQVNE